MTNNLPADLQKFRAFLSELVSAMRPRVPYASALVTQLGGTVITKSRSEDRINPVQPHRGIRITAWDGATFHSVATGNLNDRDYLIRLAQELAQSISIKSARMPEVGPSLDKHFESTFEQDPYQITQTARKEKLLHIFDFCTKYDQRIVETRAINQFNQEYRLFCNGTRLLSSVTTRTNLRIIMVGVQAGKQVINFKFLTGTGHEHEQVSDDELRALADQTIACLSAERITPGQYRVILTPSITGLLAHESFGHGCELDTMIRGAARAALYVGKRVGSDIVNISDFGGFPNKHGSIFFSDDATALKNQIESLLRACQSQRNKPYSLPDKNVIYNTGIALADPKIAKSDKTQLLTEINRFSKAILDATAQQDAFDLSNIELFIKHFHNTLQTSTGINIEYDSTRADVELCFIARLDDDRVAEATARISARRLDDLNPQELVKDYAGYARDIALSIPPVQHQGPVIVTGEALADMLNIDTNVLSFHASAANVYNKIARYEPGKPITGDVVIKGDRITIISDPHISFGPNSQVFSQVDGSPARMVTVVKHGNYDELIGSRRYYEYLGMLAKGLIPSGPIGNTRVEPGKIRNTELLSADKIVVVKLFSSWTTNPTNGDFACEIRLGEIRENGKITPFKGGLLIGNYFKMFADVKLSSETVNINNYYGPVSARFENLQVAG